MASSTPCRSVISRPHWRQRVPSSVLSIVIVHSPRSFCSTLSTCTSGISKGIVIWALMAVPSSWLFLLRMFHIQTHPTPQYLGVVTASLEEPYLRGLPRLHLPHKRSVTLQPVIPKEPEGSGGVAFYSVFPETVRDALNLDGVKSHRLLSRCELRKLLFR